MKKSVGIFMNTLQVGGAEKQAIFLAKALKRKYNVKLIIFHGNLCDDKLLSNVKDEKVELLRLKGNIFMRLYHFYNILKIEKIEFLFSYLAVPNIIGGIIGKLSGVGYIIGGIRNSKISRVKFNIQKFFHNQVLDYSIFNNHHGAFNLSEKGFSKNKIRIIQNAFDLKQPMMKRDKKQVVTVLSVARFVSQKDYHTAIKAIAALKELINGSYKFCYTIVGYGALEKEIRSNIINFGLEKDVQVYINPSDIDSFYKKADIFLNTSLFEGVSNSIMEAMSFSLPIVATDVGDTNKLINENGYLTSVKEDKELAAKLYSLCNSLTLRNKFGENSYNHLRDHFSFASFEKKYLNFISEISK